MRKIESMIGRRFGRLVIVEFSGRDGTHRTFSCRCDCGEITTARWGSLTNGHKRSCGCLNRETSAARCRTHGKTNSPEYESWRAMKDRCHNPSHHAYKNYGGRGIGVCERWLRFEAFLADMGCRPTPKHTLDRYPNNDGNYEPGNCRWATRSEQAFNKRRNRRDQPVTEAAE